MSSCAPSTAASTSGVRSVSTSGLLNSSSSSPLVAAAQAGAAAPTTVNMSGGGVIPSLAVMAPSCPTGVVQPNFGHYPHHLNHPFHFHGNNGIPPLLNHPTLVTSYPAGLGGAGSSSFPPAFVTLPGGLVMVPPPLSPFYAAPPPPGSAGLSAVSSSPQPLPPPPPLSTLSHHYPPPPTSSGSSGNRSPPPPPSRSPRIGTGAVNSQSHTSTPYQVSAASTPSQASPVFAPLQPSYSTTSSSANGTMNPLQLLASIGSAGGGGGALPPQPQPLHSAAAPSDCSHSMPLGRHRRIPSSGGESDSSRGYRRNQGSKPRTSLLRSRGELNTAKGNGSVAAAAVVLGCSGSGLPGKLSPPSTTSPVVSSAGRMTVDDSGGRQRHDDSLSDGATPSDTHGGHAAAASQAGGGSTSCQPSTTSGSTAASTIPNTTLPSSPPTAIHVLHCALDEHRIHQRMKQIRFGKVTAGYRNFRLAVPTFFREVGNDQHPETPKTTTECSKRRWDAMVASWRRTLHAWDDAQEAAAHRFFSQRPMLKTRSELGLEDAGDEEEYRIRTEGEIEAIRQEVAHLYPTTGTEASDAPHGVSETEGAASPALPMRKHHHHHHHGTNNGSGGEGLGTSGTTVVTGTCGADVQEGDGGSLAEGGRAMVLPQLVLPPASSPGRAFRGGTDDEHHHAEESQRAASNCGAFEFSVIDEWRTPPPLVGNESALSAGMHGSTTTVLYSDANPSGGGSIVPTLSATSPIRPARSGKCVRASDGEEAQRPPPVQHSVPHEQHVPITLPRLVAPSESPAADTEEDEEGATNPATSWIDDSPLANLTHDNANIATVEMAPSATNATKTAVRSSSSASSSRTQGKMAAMMTLMSQSTPKAPTVAAATQHSTAAASGTERRHTGASSPSRPRTGSGGNANHGGLFGPSGTGVLHRQRHPALKCVSGTASVGAHSSSPLGKVLPLASWTAPEASCTSPWYRGSSASPWGHVDPNALCDASATSGKQDDADRHVVCLTVITLEGGTTTPSSTRAGNSGSSRRPSQQAAPLLQQQTSTSPNEPNATSNVDGNNHPLSEIISGGGGGAVAAAAVASFSATPASGLVTPSSLERGRDVWYFDVRHNPSEILRSLNCVYHNTERLTFVDPPSALPLLQPVTATALFSPDVTERPLMTIEDVARWLDGARESEQGATVLLLHRGKWRGENPSSSGNISGMTYDAFVDGLDSGPPSLVDPAPVATLSGAHTPPKRGGAGAGGSGAALQPAAMRPLTAEQLAVVGQQQILPSSFAVMGSFSLSPPNGSMIGVGCGGSSLLAAGGADVSETASFAAEGITLQHFSFSPTGVTINASPLPSALGVARLSATALSSTAGPGERSLAGEPPTHDGLCHVGAGAVASYEGCRDMQTPLEQPVVGSGTGTESITPPNLMLRLAQLGPGESS